MLCLLLALLSASSPPLLSTASAQPPPAAGLPSPRAADHDGYGRMVFDWDAPVGYSADIINGELVVRFDRPVAGDFRAVVRPLAKYLRSVAVSADRRTATFPLLRRVEVKAFAGNNNSVVIDLTEPSMAAAGAPEEEVPPAPPKRLPGTPPPSGPAPAATVPNVEARAGEHGTYNRLVFDWSGPVSYSVDKQGSRATIAFARPAKIDVTAFQSGLPADITVVSADTAAKGLTVVLSVPANARLRHFISGDKVVVDVVRSANAAAPASEGLTVPLAPPPGGDVTVPSLKPLKPEESPKLPVESLTAPTAGPSPIKPIPQPKAARQAPSPEAPPAPGKAPPAEPAPAAAKPAEPAPAAKPQVPTKVFSLSIAWDKPAAAAVFQRAGYLWLVFDRRQEVDVALERRLGGEAVVSLEQLPNREATVVRLVVQPEYVPSVRRDGLLWVIDLMNQAAQPREVIPVIAPANLPTGIGITLKVADAGSVVSVPDPEVGDVMRVVPVIPTGAGVYPGRDTPDLDLLPTYQGVAIVPHVDGLEIKSTRGGVTIGTMSGSGLRLSSGPAGGPKEGKGGPAAIFDVAAWKRGGANNFAAEQRIVTNGLIGLPPARRAMAHMQAARFFFANGYAAEALGYLTAAGAEEPTLVDTAAWRALHGASELLMAHWDLAVADLDNPQLKDDEESQFWRGAAHAGSGDISADAERALAIGLPFLKDYPHRLKWPLASIAAAAAVAVGDDQMAQQALDVLDRDEASKVEIAERDYLHGIHEEMAGRYEKAISNFDSAAEGDNREYRARALFAEAELLLKTGKITAKEAADRLDRLRFAWREEPFEFSLGLRYAELQRGAGDYPAALRSLQSLVNNFPDDKDAPKAARMMSEMFDKLYLEGAADAMSPVSAIGLYDEFHELTPTGPKGDEMIRKLADRLASVDLLDRAADLLKNQVNYRLSGLDKARVGAQLALLDLLNRQPQGALDGLLASEVDGLPDDLKLQRRHLKARALADLDRVPEAVQVLAGDNSAEGALLRAEIHWRSQSWADAATDFESLVPRPERGATLDAASAKLVLSWATALVLAADERGLAALRRNYAPAMAGTDYKEGFALLTSALDRDVPDMPAIAGKIKEAEAFQSFMSNYRKRMQSAGLSAIN